MNWVKYVPCKGKSQLPYASISKCARMIAFNAAATERYLTEATHVILYFDAIDRRIGVKVCPEDEIGSMRLRRRSSGSDICIQSFASCFDLKALGSIRRLRIKEGDDGMLILDLREAPDRKAVEE